MKQTNAWNRILIGNDNHIERRNISWNVAGSAIYAVTSILLGAAVTRVLGADPGGIFFFAFSTFGQQMFIVSYFGLRPVQITDTSGRHSFGDYRSFRFLTCAASVVISALYVMLFVSGPVKKTVVLIMAVYKTVDGFADCWDSEFQRNGRLYLTGKSNAGRTLLSVAAFMAVLLLSRDLVMSCVAALCAQIAGFFLFCLMPAGALRHIDYTVHKTYAKELFAEGKWLFLSAFLDLYIFAASKYAVNSFMSDADNSYYSTIFIPTSVINLMANFIIRPVLTTLSDDWGKHDVKAFVRKINRILKIILILTFIGMGAGYLFGIPVLSLLLGKETGANLKPYTAALVTVILGGGFYAALNLLYYVLVILKKEKQIFLIYGISCISAFAVSDICVRKWGISGAASAYLLSMILLTAMFAAAAWRVIRSAPGEKYDS